MKTPANLAMLLLAVWFILYGVLSAPFLHISFPHSLDVLSVLAIVVGVLLFMRR
jgi:drug/metabolite transporter (DMT)-like permease